ncbi:MAG: hypothetical protein EPO28_00885 [Saprospiraceae bacterium]|nr:MAG: hypothetical protein EPO28_00885 [Saprospiraceae bacterium]
MEKLSETSFAGPLHNKVMQRLTTLPSFPRVTKSETYNEARIIILDYYATNGLGTPQMIDFSTFESKVDQVLANQNDFVPLLEQLKNEHSITVAQFDKLLQINSLFVNQTGINKLTNDLFGIENALYDETAMTFNEKALVFGTSVIGRNSAYYWFSAANDPNDPWNDDVVQAIPWWKRALRDLLGFTIGYVVGSIISGGIPIVGVAAGAATATGASANETP